MNRDYQYPWTASLPLLLALTAPPIYAFPRPLLPEASAPGGMTSTLGGAAPVDPFRLADRQDAGNRVLLAHAILVKSSPEKEATITDVPEEVLLIFNESVGDEFLALAVIDESGKRVDHHDPQLDFTDRSHLRATVSKLSPGRYTVRYRVLSADGHVVSGKYFFTLQGK